MYIILDFLMLIMSAIGHESGTEANSDCSSQTKTCYGEFLFNRAVENGLGRLVLFVVVQCQGFLELLLIVGVDFRFLGEAKDRGPHKTE